jgi:hypothetical protein
MGTSGRDGEQDPLGTHKRSTRIVHFRERERNSLSTAALSENRQTPPSLAWIPWSALWLGGTQRVQCTRKRHRRLESVASPDVRLAAIISTSSARVLHSALVSQLLSVRPRRDATVGCTAQLRSPRRAPSGTGHLRFLPGEDAKVPQAGFLSIEA